MKFTAENMYPANTWQIGTGDDTRMYFDIFLKFGVALVGPGSPGKEGEGSTIEYYKNHPDINNKGAVLNSVKKGQWLIARKGRRSILGIGHVTEGYNYSQVFSDVEGWDLQHFVKVEWYIPADNLGELLLPGNSLSMRTLQGCNNPGVFEYIYAAEFERCPAPVDPVTLSSKELVINNIVSKLVDEGVRIQDAENIGDTLERIIRLASYYINYDDQALEAETISFLVIPFLIALGWSEQKIKLQYSNIDIAIFKEAFAGDYHLHPEIIIEAKQFNNGLAFTNNQIKMYAEKFPDCKKFIATNGSRYKYFEKENDELVWKGYFNLLQLKEREILRGLPIGSVDTILKISNFY